MFEMTLDGRMLSREERDVFAGYLSRHGLDEAIWDVFECFTQVGTRMTQPRVLRAHDGGRLVGVAFMARCRAWSGAVFANRLLQQGLDLFGIPACVWIRVGFCAEILANPGFVADGCDYAEVIGAMIDYLRKHSYGTIIIDHAEDEGLHSGSMKYPYVCDGVVPVDGMRTAQDYIDQHRNIKRKIKAFTNKGGTIEVVRGALPEALLDTLGRCMTATVARSVIHAPFQDSFIDVTARTCQCPSENLVHFIAWMNGEMLGYHTFVQTGRGLRMLHGAFDRERRTTYHCYENIIIDTVRFAIEHGLEAVYFGPVMNETKRRMMVQFGKSTLHFYSN
ncbi:MAG: GNAT family N-acetyltransferase, partial [Nitrospiraceae bacterium]|nr:GNAT family N-acetyltransferase [Nitrospiraceae bacterium]